MERAAALPMKPVLAKLATFLGGGYTLSESEGSQSDDTKFVLGGLDSMNSILEAICERPAVTASLVGSSRPEGMGQIEDGELQVLMAKLEAMNTLLQALWEREDVGMLCKDLMMEVRDLSYDMEDAIDDLTHGKTNVGCLFGQLKIVVKGAKERFSKRWKTTRTAISNSSEPDVDPTAHFLPKDASELVGMDEPRNELLELLVHDVDKRRKVPPQRIGKPYLQEIVIKLQAASNDLRSKAIELVTNTDGVDSVTLTGDGEDRLIVLGDCLDSVNLTSTIRKRGCPRSQLFQVGYTRKQRVMIRMQVASHDEVSQNKAKRLVKKMEGVELVKLTGDRRDQLRIVIGDGVDPVKLTRKVRKKVGHAELLETTKKPAAYGRYGNHQRFEELKMVCILGLGGSGKTALADLLYHETNECFQRRAFVSVSRRPNITGILRTILTQVTNKPYATTEAVPQESLSSSISVILESTRYLVIIDNIWRWEEWRIIRQSLPKNNLGSRIIMTTRSNDIAEKCRTDGIDTVVYETGVLDHWDAWKLSGTAVMKSVRSCRPGNNEDNPCYDILEMCYGMPLALMCMSSALVEKMQGLDGDLQNLRALRLAEDGILTIPCLKPLAQSLSLGYDELPVHLTTSLLYCSIYRWHDKFERDTMVRRWIVERFVYGGEEATGCWIEKEKAANGFFDDLVNMKWIKPVEGNKYEIHPVMLAFLRCKSQEYNFVTCLGFGSDVSSLSSTRIRRLSLQYGHSVDFSRLDLSCTRSLVVFDDASAVPFKRFQRLRVLDLQDNKDLQDAHLEEICGLLWLRYLCLRGTRIRKVPPEIGALMHLETLDVSYTSISALPQQIGTLQHLENLDVNSTTISELPPAILGLQHLIVLGLSNTRLDKLPGKLQHLKTLQVRNTCINKLEIHGLPNLERLDLSHTKISQIPPEIMGLRHLETLNISNTEVEELPPEIRELQYLKTLDVNTTGIVSLPSELWELQRLVTMDVSYSWLVDLPPEIGRLQHLKRLNLRSTYVGNLPPEIRQLKDLQTLDLSTTMIEELPPEVRELQRLETLDLSSTSVSKLPSEIWQLQNLKTLNLSCTKVNNIPPAIRGLQHLQTLNLRNTDVSQLPPEIWRLQHLEILDMSNTMVSELPWEAVQMLKSVHVFAGYGIIRKRVRLPEALCQILGRANVESSPANCREALSIGIFDPFGMGMLHVASLKVPGIHMHVPQLIKQHASVLSSLDIRLCKVHTADANFMVLREMPSLQVLVLRLEVLPREPIAISCEGFKRLESFCVDSRVPRITFEPGAMRRLKHLAFKFYAGPASKDRVGITNLRSLQKVIFLCSSRYKSDSPGISATIDVVRREAQEHPKRITLCINDKEEVFP